MPLRKLFRRIQNFFTRGPTEQQPSSHQQQQHDVYHQSQPLQHSNIIQKEHLFMVRIVIIVDRVVRKALQEIFLHGAPSKVSSETLKEYLMREKGMVNLQFRKAFNRTSREKIDDDPSCQSFDVTLWVQAIKYGCDNLAPPDAEAVWVQSPESFENHIKRIKDFRNSLMHSKFAISEKEFYEKLEELRGLLVNTMTLFEQRYSVDANKIKDEILLGINELRDCPLEDLSSYDSTSLFNALKDILENSGTADLEKIFEWLSNVNPAALIAGQDIQIEVGLIYTALEIIEGGRNRTGERIDHTNFLKLALDSAEKRGKGTMQVILVEGIAGVGKTTLIKKMCSEWLSLRKNKHYSVKELDRYKFIIPIECRSHSYKSLAELISSIMPTPRKVFREEQHMLDCLFDFHTLFILDGFDELTPESKRVFQEILELKQRDHVTVMCTTRPETISDFYLLIPDHVNTMHFMITGIPSQNKEIFVKQYHEQLKKLGISKQETEGLLLYLRTTGARLQDQWNLPLNLSLVTLLWAVSPESVNRVTTAIELMSEIHDLTVVKLKERLVSQTDLLTDKLEEKINDFLFLLCKEALFGIRDAALLIPDNALKRLRDNCSDSKMPSKELLGAFMVQRNSWSPITIFHYVTFPNKSGQEFYAAKHIYNEVFGSSSSILQREQEKFLKLLEDMGTLTVSLPSIYDKLQTSCKTVAGVFHDIHKGMNEIPSLQRYQNTITLLLGLLYHNNKTVDEELARELVELLKEAGVIDREQWIMALNSVKCDPMISKLVSEMPGFMDGTVRIEDSNVFAYVSLLKSNLPKEVTIKIYGEPNDIPFLDDLLIRVGEEGVNMKELSFEHLFRYPQTAGCNVNGLDPVIQRCRINVYTGQMLPNFTQYGLGGLHVSLPDSNSALALWDYLGKRKGRLHSLGVSVGKQVSLQALQPLPEDIKYLSLYMPDVGSSEIENACLMAKALQPVTGTRAFTRLYFPRCQLTSYEIKTLLTKLQEVKVSRVLYFPEMCTHARQSIEEMARTYLGCDDISWGGIEGGGIDDMASW